MKNRRRCIFYMAVSAAELASAVPILPTGSAKRQPSRRHAFLKAVVDTPPPAGRRRRPEVGGAVTSSRVTTTAVGGLSVWTFRRGTMVTPDLQSCGYSVRLVFLAGGALFCTPLRRLRALPCTKPEPGRNMTWLFKLTVDGEHKFVSLCSVCCGRQPAPIVTNGAVKNDPDVLNRSPQPRIRVRNQRTDLISHAGYLFVNYFLIYSTTETEQYSIPSII